MGTSNFYHALPGFRDFAALTRDENFSAVPGDWLVIIVDVEGSTLAIERGQYKDVNTIGAASIVAAHNALGDLAFPYAFGGDGATMLIPPDALDAVANELASLRELAHRQYGLDLRVGVVKVRELEQEDASIEVAKYLLAGDKPIAMLRGNGLELAEMKVKRDTARYEIGTASKKGTDLRRLSCRWQPIPAENGVSLSLLVVARGAEPGSCYRRLLGELERIFDGRLEDANPLGSTGLACQSIAECYREEKRMHVTPFSCASFQRLFEIIASVLIFRFGVPPLFFNPKRYAASMGRHSDYRKFDGVLRMVLHCSREQAASIRELCKTEHGNGAIYFGVHETDSSLMTCFVDGLNDGEHIHFIDGSNGGYAMAAKAMKAQIEAG